MSGDPFNVSTELCPRIRAIELASCEDLSSASWLSGLMAPMQVLRAVSNVKFKLCWLNLIRLSLVGSSST